MISLAEFRAGLRRKNSQDAPAPSDRAQAPCGAVASSGDEAGGGGRRRDEGPESCAAGSSRPLSHGEDANSGARRQDGQGKPASPMADSSRPFGHGVDASRPGAGREPTFENIAAAYELSRKMSDATSEADLPVNLDSMQSLPEVQNTPQLNPPVERVGLRHLLQGLDSSEAGEHRAPPPPATATAPCLLAARSRSQPHSEGSLRHRHSGTNGREMPLDAADTTREWKSEETGHRRPGQHRASPGQVRTEPADVRDNASDNAPSTPGGSGRASSKSGQWWLTSFVQNMSTRLRNLRSARPPVAPLTAIDDDLSSIAPRAAQ